MPARALALHHSRHPGSSVLHTRSVGWPGPNERKARRGTRRAGDRVSWGAPREASR